MLQHTNRLMANLKPTGKCLLTLFVLIFVFSITTYAFTTVLQDTKNAESTTKTQETEINEENEINATVVRILMSANDQRATMNDEKVSKFLLVNIEQQNDTERLLATTIKEQKPRLQHQQNKRDVSNTADQQNNNNQSTVKQGYYEEQQPVVVHAETLPTLGRRQDNYGAPPRPYQDAYYARPASAYDDEEDDASQEGADGYPYEQRPTAGYYGDDNDDRQASEERVGGEAESVGEGRAAGNSAYDSYYRQWHYATPAPVQRPNGGWEVGNNRQMQNGERDPYAAYDADGPMEDYEYPGALTPSQKQQYEQQLLKRQQLQPRPQNRPQQTTTMEQQQQAVQGADPHNRPTTSSNSNNNPPTENSLLSTLKSLKTMWDIYQAFSAAWNSLATHRQQQEQQRQEAAKRRQQQIAQQTRINSKKPPKIGANDKYTQRNSSSSAESSEVTVATAPNAAKRVKPNNRATKNPKTTTTTAAQSTTSTEFVASSEVEETVANSSSNNRNAGSKGDTMARQNAQGNREKRQSTDTAVTESTDVGEGRYIKGDPLKGYYDFVITEGSYKFWAVFQTGTALLIIYSTFAAIYYSKVNPLVSDYDYTDYLGGARSLSGGDEDFIDDDSDGGEGGGKQGRRSSWLNAMLPRAGRTLQYILDALDKLPVDHREADEAMRGERAGVATTNRQAFGEDYATGNAYENDDDADDATRQSAEEVGGAAAPEELEATQRQVRAYAA
ncbi:caprin homolog [Bactrocera dorsalis]|uniref:Caprin homolog n=1 Tax=Bactrocera dorsalis TaxID=27457 RepID=A0ABM3JEK7_BACDO|nr:caprin homolog [Bactrocera dorsalis]